MVDNTVRARLVETTKGLWGNLNKMGVANIYETFGSINLPGGSGGSNYYDTVGFYSIPKVYSGDKQKYVYGQFKVDMKPRKFLRYNGGVKLEEAQFAMDDDVLRGMIETLVLKEERAVNSRMRRDAIGFANEIELVSVLAGQGTANSSIINPADCNATPGTAAALGAVNWSGAGKTERNIQTVIGAAIRGLQNKVLDANTEETILKEEGNTYIFWVHPTFKSILDTENDLLDTTHQDTMPYTERLAKSWGVTVKSTMHIDSYTGATDATATGILTANTKENFFVVKVENPTWRSWKEIDDGESIEMVKRYVAGNGYIAKSYIGADNQPYKAMYASVSTPNGA